MTKQMLDHIRALYPGAQCLPDRRIEMFIIRDFLDHESCGALIARIESHVRPSTIAGDEADLAFRTSETCDMFAEQDDFIAALDVCLAALIGVDPRHGETNQGQRYLVGQEFKLHTDYFDPGPQYDAHCMVAGQRTWTAMAYLNEPEAGGATRFKRIDRTIQPETGKLLLWNNLTADGQCNYDTLHQGLKVRAGRKYVMTKWFRERPFA
jgi:prolyl 4-hydroxylase